MATKETPSPELSAGFQANLTRIEALTKRLGEVLAARPAPSPDLPGPGVDFYAKTFSAYWAEMLSNPTKIWEQQAEYWGRTLAHAVSAQQAMLGGDDGLVPADITPEDRRFAHPLWHSHPYFNYLKQQYFINADAMRKMVETLPGLEPKERQRLAWFTGQIIDLMAPGNFLVGNPEAMIRAMESEGKSLVDGLENLIRDLERNQGELMVTLSDPEAFTLGENLATTEGAVVYRNQLFELIQYAPRTEQVHKTPLIIFPPWINKFYILDLKPENSLIRWITEQGYTLFVVSWVNPDARHADLGLEAYIEDGFLQAMAQVKGITGEEKLNVVGYCIGGTTLALTLALMRQRGDESVNAATFFTAMTDLSDQGELEVFMGDDFIGGIEAEVAKTGIMPSLFMARTFSFLRANDLIYRPAIRSYLMGEAPPAFDLLHWNGDGTNLPGRMAVEYLRGLCQKNSFARGGLSLFGKNLKISDVDVPLCAVACESDHIAPWTSSYRGIRQMGSKDKSFILSESGHVAGVVNPPSKKKYGHYLNADWPEEPEDWQAGAAFQQGSWWPSWESWLAPRSGPMIPARDPGGPDNPVLEPAPGSYVRQPARG